MALLGFLSRKDKKSSKASSSSPKPSPNPSDSTSVQESEYVSVRRDALPHATNGLYKGPPAAAASSSRLRQAFARKKSPTPDDIQSFPSPPPLPYSPSAKSEADADRFRPPPSKSSLFSAYADPQGALSTRSLPTKRTNHARSRSREVASVDAHSNSEASPTQPAKKSGGLFAWAHRERKKSKPTEPIQPFPLSVDLGTDSFNLRSFRHIGVEPAPSVSMDLPRPPSVHSNTPFHPPHARPRGDSLISVDSAQRVSVAAFREMAARSRNASPSPSLRPPSTTDLTHLDPHAPSHLRPGGGIRPPVLSTRSSVANALFTSTDTESDEDSEQEDSGDSGGSETLRPKRNKTITKKPGKASTELGHRMRTPPSAPPARTAKSSLGHGESPSPSPQITSSSSREGRPNAFARTRASASTSALQPNAAARRASMLAANKGVPVPSFPRKSLAISSSDSSDDESDDSDNAPLASFMNPKRPGSAASNGTSGSRPRMPAKPLIDISLMSTPALSTGSTLNEKSPPLPQLPSHPPPVPEKFRTHPDKPSLSDRLAKLTQNSAASRSTEVLPPAPLERRSADLLRLEGDNENTKGKEPEKEDQPKGRKLPTRSQTAPMDTTIEPQSSSPPSPTFTRPNRRSLTSPNAAAFDLTDTAPIVPRRIRERSPPPAFSVTSRPISQVSVGSGHKLSNPPLPPPALRATAQQGSTSNITSSTSSTSATHHSHNSSTSTIRMLASSTSATSTTTTSTSSVTSSMKPSSTTQLPPKLPSLSSSTPTPRASAIPPSTDSPPSSPSSSDSSSSAASPPISRPKTTLAPPGNSQAILRAPPPRTSSRPRASTSSTLIANNGKPPSDAFTGGGLVSTIQLDDSGKKATSSFATGAIKTRQRSSTTIPMVDTGPSLTKVFSDSSFGSGSSRYPFESGASSASAGSSSRGGAGSAPPAVSSSSQRPPSSLSQPRPPSALSQPQPRQRPLLANTNTSSSSGGRLSTRPPSSNLPYIPSPSSGVPPPKPFAERAGARGNSPSSSTGDSSSGRTPLTPADGSDLGSGYSNARRSGETRRSGPGARGDASAVSAGGKGHRKTGSVGFSEPDRERARTTSLVNGTSTTEERRKERRRSEAKNAIELGNVVNGRGPIAHDDDEDVPLNNMGPRLSMVNPMFNLTPPTPMPGWRPPSAVLPPQSFMFPMPPANADPAFLAAHQQAMMVAKQAYQFAVAQQAMAQANEEWERGSSATSAFGSPGFGGMGMGMYPGYGMGMQPGYGMMFPTSAQSMYAPSLAAGSELSVNMGGGGGWGTRSEYGGPTSNRNSQMYRNSGVGFGQAGMGGGIGMGSGMVNSAQSHYGPLESGNGSRPGPRPRTKTAPSAKQAPPSSWKATPQRGA